MALAMGSGASEGSGVFCRVVVRDACGKVQGSLERGFLYPNQRPSS